MFCKLHPYNPQTSPLRGFQLCPFHTWKNWDLARPAVSTVIARVRSEPQMLTYHVALYACTCMKSSKMCKISRWSGWPGTAPHALPSQGLSRFHEHRDGHLNLSSRWPSFGSGENRLSRTLGLAQNTGSLVVELGPGPIFSASQLSSPCLRVSCPSALTVVYVVAASCMACCGSALASCRK